MNPVEIELKLAIPPKAAAKAAGLDGIAVWKSGRAALKTMHSTYFDTPDLRLFKAGITLRLRVNGRNRLMTVKTAGSRVGGLFSRREWEWHINSDSVDCALAQSTGLPELADPAITNALMPIFNTQIKRRLHILQGPDWSVEMAVDLGAVDAAERSIQISEIELELQSGDPMRLFDIAEILAAALPCRILDQSKSDRGFAAFLGQEPVPVKAKPNVLQADMSVMQAFRNVARNCLGHLTANEAALYGPHGAESIHQMRVALRRFRSALKVFKPVLDPEHIKVVASELRLLLAHLGPARDADVFLDEIIDPAIAEYDGGPCLLRLRQEWSQRRDTDFAAARKAVESADFTLLQLRLGRWVESLPDDQKNSALPAFARKVLRRCLRRMLNAGGKNLRHLSAPHLHEVRILGKQMRYAAEFFASLYPKAAAKPFLILQADLQEYLGGLNDLSVAGERLARCRHDPDLAWAAGLISGGHEIKRPILLNQAQETWKNLSKTAPFWEKK